MLTNLISNLGAMSIGFEISTCEFFYFWTKDVLFFVEDVHVLFWVLVSMFKRPSLTLPILYFIVIRLVSVNWILPWGEKKKNLAILP
jgi:hypothetical protein